MPSLDTIRTITIRGQADGVDQTRAALDRLTASIQAANENLVKTKQVANDNASSFAITGEGAANAANHLRQAAEAAYAFSPAFRGVVNELAVPALKGAGVALEGVATGIVTATNVAGAGVIRLGTAIETTFPAFAVLAGNVKVAGAAMEAFSPSLGGAAATILSRVLPALTLLGRGLLIYDAIKLVTEAWRLGNERLAEYVALSEKASSSGISTDFYQRITKAAEDAKIPVEALAEAFKKLNEASAPTLGGSTARNRLDELVKLGNFGGNSGVGELKGANSNEERLRALASLIDQATAKGERLAALDIAKAFGGDQLAANLAKDAGYLDKMIESADAIAQKELISAGDIARAVDLQNRLDAAEKILSQRWHPIQELLADLGVKMKETWVSIVEAIAKAVDAVFGLGQRIAEMLAPLTGFIQSAGQLIGKAAPYLALAPGGLGIPAAAGAATIGALSTPNSGGDAEAAQRQALLADARKRLAEAMNRKFDISTPPPVGDTANAYSRATEAVLKYIEVTKAAAETVGKTVAEQEKAKVVAQLTAAAMKDGTPITAALRDEMARLGDKAAVAAQALEKAKIAADIKFNRDTAFLSQQDVQIATALKGLYPDVATALGSVEAQGMRANSAFRSMSSALEGELTNGLTDIVSGTKSASQGFQDMATAIVRAIEQMIIKIAIVEPLMRSLQQAAGGLGLLGSGGAVNANGSISGAVGPTSVNGAPLVGLHAGGIVGAEATFYRSVAMSAFAGAPRFHTGGIAGDEVPIIARKGEGVFTPGQMAAMGSSGGNARAPNIVINNHTEAQPQVSTAPNGDVTITLKKMMDNAVGDSIAGGSGSRRLKQQFGLKPFMGQ
jgi:hypothetical protein